MSAYARNAIILGLLTAIGPFAIDMYLPAMPTIALALHTSTAATQMTLMAYFAGFGLSQLVYGPVSDMFGRKLPLYFGLTLFIIGSAGCALSPSIEWLIFFRFIQSLGGAALMLTRAIIRDLHTGIEATRLMSTVMLVLSVSPMFSYALPRTTRDARPHSPAPVSMIAMKFFSTFWSASALSKSCFFRVSSSCFFATLDFGPVTAIAM